MKMVVFTMKINNDRVCVISDLHLGVHSNSPNWHDIALKWAKWQCKEFNKHNIADVIFCGDWHHNRNEISVSTLQISADILDIFSEFNIFIVVGNHDIFYKHRVDVNSLSIFKNRQNVHIIDTVQTLTYNNKNITLCPWNTQIDDIPQSDVIFGHFEIETFKMNAFKVCDHGLKVSSLLRKSPLIVSGHFHTRHEKTYQAGTILYVGNPFEMDFGDMDNEKGYYILDLSTLEYEFFINAISPKHKKTTLDKTLQHSTTLRTTLQHSTKTLQHFTTFHKTLQNSTQLNTIMHNSTQLDTTLHNSTQLYTTLHNSTQFCTTFVK